MTRSLIPRVLAALVGIHCFFSWIIPHRVPADDAKSGTEPPLILAHYMPWYTAKPASEEWGWHWTMNHFDPEKQTDGRREIASKFYPLIGPYDSGDVDVLEYHLLTMKLAGMDGVIVDWYGRTDFRDYAVLNRNTYRLLQQCERLKMKFVICYEDQTIPALVEGERIEASQRVSHARQEINWLAKYWFQSPSYVRIDDLPVMLSFGHEGLTPDEWTRCLKQLDAPIAYYSQDYRRDGAVGAFGWPSPQAGLQQTDRFLNASKQWPDHIPAAFPRFDDIYRDAKVSEGYPVLPDNDGETFKSTLAAATDHGARIIQLATWNDWGEGTQLEPSHEFGYRDLEVVQKVQRAGWSKVSMVKATDLRLPLRLLKLRRSGQVDSETLDAVAESIASWHLDEVSFNQAREFLNRTSNPAEASVGP